MIASVSISDDGDVQVMVDTDEAEDDTKPLSGLVLDDILDLGSRTAIDTWFSLRETTTDVEPAEPEPESTPKAGGE